MRWLRCATTAHRRSAGQVRALSGRPQEYFEARFGGAMQAESIKRTNLRSISIFATFAGLHLLFHSPLAPTSLSPLPAMLADPGSAMHQMVQIAISPAWNFLGMAGGIVLWYANVKYARSLVNHITILPSGLVKLKTYEFYGKPSDKETVYFLRDFKLESVEGSKSPQVVYHVPSQLQKYIFDRRDKKMEQIFARAAAAASREEPKPEDLQLRKKFK